jgi:hypothetical protein
VLQELAGFFVDAVVYEHPGHHFRRRHGAIKRNGVKRNALGESYGKALA